MKTVPVQEAVGMVLCHDLTRIVPGEFKGRAFEKGHVVQEDDVEALLKIGKENLYVWEVANGFVHENEAARRCLTTVPWKTSGPRCLARTVDLPGGPAKPSRPVAPGISESLRKSKV